eukprot:COSAG01_NODE_2642_length_7323_cov_13.197121_7_plen_314_part_00
MLQDLISVKDLNPELIDTLFRTVPEMQTITKNKQQPCDYLKGYVLSNLFFEASTRSRMSFSSAFMYLGGQVNSTTGVVFSSISKGESLADTLRVIGSYCDILVIRHPDLGSADVAAKHVDIPVINAGDGPGEHPTQALLDLYTIHKEKKGLNNLHVTMVGDLKYGRTVHSLARLLALYPNISLTFVAPDAVQVPQSLLDSLKQAGCQVSLSQDLEQALKTADVVYTTRIQKERFTNQADAEKIEGSYSLNKTKVLKYCKNNVTIMHPLPRLSEIHPDVDSLPNAAYFRQAENGLYVRMALFLAMLRPDLLKPC